MQKEEEEEHQWQVVAADGSKNYCAVAARICETCNSANSLQYRSKRVPPTIFMYLLRNFAIKHTFWGILVIALHKDLRNSEKLTVIVQKRDDTKLY